MSNHYTYRAEWSPEDGEFVGLVAEFPSLSWLAATAAEAVAGASDLVDGILADMAKTGETPPEPLTQRKYSGNLSFRTSPAQHRALAIEAAEQGVSVNQLLVYKTALHAAGIAEMSKAGQVDAVTTPASGEAVEVRDRVVVEHRVKLDAAEGGRTLVGWNALPENIRTDISEAVRASVLTSIPSEFSAANLIINSPGMKEVMAKAMEASGFVETMQETARRIGESLNGGGGILGGLNLDQIVGPQKTEKGRSL